MSLWEALAHILKIPIVNFGVTHLWPLPIGVQGLSRYCEREAEAETVFVEVDVLSDDLCGIGPDTPIFCARVSIEKIGAGIEKWIWSLSLDPGFGG